MSAIGEQSFVFISYDEPNAEAHWQGLRRLVPQALRVHGVKGFVSAHKAAARLATTERFVTVDGDCLIDATLLDYRPSDDELNSDAVLSWPTRNVVNGVAYGGAIKCWTRHMLAAWTADDARHLDLDDDFDFIIQGRVFGSTHVNGSPLQAYRSGFREGARLGLLAGERAGLANLATVLPPQRWRRLRAWLTIGSDAACGKWCIWGARDGCLAAQSGTLDRSLIADHHRFAAHFADAVEPRGAAIDAEIRTCGERLRDGGLALSDLSPEQSAFFRRQLAERLNAEAFDMLGNAYRSGRDLPNRPDKAFEAYLTGALLGHGNAMNNVARCYREGLGVRADPVAARNWLMNAAAVGNPWALVRLGTEALRAGDAAATGWLTRAAAAGNREAAQLLETGAGAETGTEAGARKSS